MSLNLKGRYNLLRQAMLQNAGVPTDDLDTLKQMATYLRIPATHDADAAVSLLVIQTLIATHDKMCLLDAAYIDVPDALVQRFLSWPMPNDSVADMVTVAPGVNRTGTNLLTAEDAGNMLKHVLWGNWK